MAFFLQIAKRVKSIGQGSFYLWFSFMRFSHGYLLCPALSSRVIIYIILEKLNKHSLSYTALSGRKTKMDHLMHNPPTEKGHKHYSRVGGRNKRRCILISRDDIYSLLLFHVLLGFLGANTLPLLIIYQGINAFGQQRIIIVRARHRRPRPPPL